MRSGLPPCIGLNFFCICPLSSSPARDTWRPGRAAGRTTRDQSLPQGRGQRSPAPSSEEGGGSWFGGRFFQPAPPPTGFPPTPVATRRRRFDTHRQGGGGRGGGPWRRYYGLRGWLDGDVVGCGLALGPHVCSGKAFGGGDWWRGKGFTFRLFLTPPSGRGGGPVHQLASSFFSKHPDTPPLPHIDLHFKRIFMVDKRSAALCSPLQGFWWRGSELPSGFSSGISVRQPAGSQPFSDPTPYSPAVKSEF